MRGGAPRLHQSGKIGCAGFATRWRLYCLVPSASPFLCKGQGRMLVPSRVIPCDAFIVIASFSFGSETSLTHVSLALN
eukprot:3006362-Amphidinium_carterae.1